MISRRLVRLGTGVAGGLLGLVGVTLVGVALADQRSAPPAAPDIASTSPSTGTFDRLRTASGHGSTGSAESTTLPATATATPTPSSRRQESTVVLPESVPRRISIPAARVDSSIVDLGLTAAGEMETPKNPDQVGWFTGAHTPGAPGVAVLAGHVTWNREPTVFFRLGELQRGDRISVDRADGSRVTFAVQRRSTFGKDVFPTREVYRPSAKPELVLITCGGRYDTRQHRYEANVIVWASLVGVTR